MDILRFTTAGSVDDGKSTLIGRLLYDTGNIKNDVLQSLNNKSSINLAYVTDGLRAERQGGITIDVAYKYFNTLNRKYIVTDAPGHFQFTKNMVTGASSVDAIIILVDALNGITAQTLKHAEIASFLRIANTVIAINKMDAKNYDETVFNDIKNDFITATKHMQLTNTEFIPISALLGDNISAPSLNMLWYNGKTIIDFLETCAKSIDPDDGICRFVTQYVSGNYIFGRQIGGTIKPGDIISIHSRQTITRILQIIRTNKEVAVLSEGEDGCLLLERDFKVERGDIIALNTAPLSYGNIFKASLCWLNGLDVLKSGNVYTLRAGALETDCTIGFIEDQVQQKNTISVNEFAQVQITTIKPLPCALPETLYRLRRGILIDKESYATVAALVIR